jgi:MFS superfamily sulfate permease-like transporter
LKNRIKINLQEISGGFGDMGTFIPLSVSLVLVCGLDAGSILLTIGEIAASGIGVAVMILLLSSTRLVEKGVKRIPDALVKGILLGVGIKLGIKGFQFILKDGLTELINVVPVIICAAVIISSLRFKKIPGALLAFAAGLALVFIKFPEITDTCSLGWKGFQLTWPSAHEWFSGFTRASIPQLPLTLVNSVIAVCALSKTLFPDKSLDETRIAFSVSFMNLVSCLFGGTPVCHGSGGLAAQYRFGGRTGGSPVFIGIIKILTALIFGASAITILAAYPSGILGLLLVVSGLELARPAIKRGHWSQMSVTIVTAGVILFFNSAIGFCAGIITHVIIFILQKQRSAKK